MVMKDLQVDGLTTLEFEESKIRSPYTRLVHRPDSGPLAHEGYKSIVMD
jgi:hypothetical protein